MDKLESSAGKRGGGNHPEFRKLFIVTRPRPRVLDCGLHARALASSPPCQVESCLELELETNLRKDFTDSQAQGRLECILKATVRIFAPAISGLLSMYLLCLM